MCSGNPVSFMLNKDLPCTVNVSIIRCSALIPLLQVLGALHVRVKLFLAVSAALGMCAYDVLNHALCAIECFAVRSCATSFIIVRILMGGYSSMMWGTFVAMLVSPYIPVKRCSLASTTLVLASRLGSWNHAAAAVIAARLQLPPLGSDVISACAWFVWIAILMALPFVISAASKKKPAPGIVRSVNSARPEKWWIFRLCASAHVIRSHD